jgi:predicted NUDIX family phosphoesterase
VSNHEDEKVLCLPREVIPKNWLTESTCEPLSWSGFSHCLESAAGVWIPRSIAEYDASLKQLIPYVVVKKSGTGTIACYRRHGSEDRLHGLWSVGIGGHINEADTVGPGGNRWEAVQNCVNREIYEELGIQFDNILCRFLGIINEEITEVGTVHLGLVFKILIDGSLKVLPGDELGCFQWVKIEKIRRLDLELWSRLAMHLMLEE